MTDIQAQLPTTLPAQSSTPPPANGWNIYQTDGSGHSGSLKSGTVDGWTVQMGYAKITITAPAYAVGHSYKTYWGHDGPDPNGLGQWITSFNVLGTVPAPTPAPPGPGPQPPGGC